MELVTLGVEVKTTGSQQAAQQLGQFSTAAKGAAGSADALEDQIRSLGTAQTQVAGSARPLSGAMTGIGNAFKNNSSAIQNAAFQLSDLIVQMEMGVPATRALGQQLPQLLGGLGGIGAVVGVAVGALLSLAPTLLSTAEDTKTLQERIDELSDTIGSLRDLSNELSSLDQLAEKYGKIDEELISLLGHMREQQILAAQQQATDAVAAIAEEYKVATGAVNLFRITGQGAARDIADDLGLTRNGFLALQAAIRDAETAQTLEAQASAVAKIVEILSKAPGADADLVAAATSTALKLREAAEAGQDLNNVDLTGSLGSAADQASRMADEIGRAAANALSAAQNAAAALQDAQIRLQYADDPVGRAGALAAAQLDRSAGVMRGSEDAIIRQQFEETRAQVIAAAEEAARYGQELSALERTMRGGAKTTNEIETAAQRLYASTRTEAEQYQIELEKVQELYALGAIDADVYGRAIEDLNRKFDPMQQLIQSAANSIESELNNAFASVIKGTSSLSDALLNFASNVLAKVAQDLFAQQFSAPIASGISGFLGGFFGAPGVGAQPGTGSMGLPRPFAKGGVVSGPTIFPFASGIGLMGEAGPEAIMPLARGADGSLGVVANGGGSAPTITINNYSGQEATASTDSAGNITVEIGRALAQDITSGGPAYRAIRSTFGLSNRLQQRG